MNAISKTQNYELADIVRKYKTDYLNKYKTSYQQIKILHAIENCRTSVLGGHKDVCTHCGENRMSYNSCRNRHCPKCQFTAKEKWLAKQRKNLLPINYFHTVFTIPSQLHEIFYSNQKICYSLLFKSVKETLLTIGADEKHLGAKIGFLAILHTWGQNLMYHPHIHCIVSGGGLKKSGGWKNCKDNFLFPVQVLSVLFQKKLLFYLKKAYLKEEIKQNDKFMNIISQLYNKKWVVYSKKPFANADKVLCYLGRYTHRVAIGNSRIKNIENDMVSFRYKDYRAGGKQKIMKLSAIEFLRRFLMHVLPSRFVKIRSYGFLSNPCRKKLLPICEIALNVFGSKKLESLKDCKVKQNKFNFTKCPFCKNETMQTVEIFHPTLSKYKRKPP